MGLGKTVITLTALWLLLFDYFEVRRILVIAPKRVAETTWPAEIKKWEHLYGMTFAVAMGTAEQRKEALLSGADVTIIGRDNVSWMTKNIFFDFNDVSFLDSSGIGLIMGRYKKVMFIGGKAAVTNVGNAVDRIFKISGLYKIIEKYDTIQEALYENRI